MSRRGFLRGIGTTAIATAATNLQAAAQEIAAARQPSSTDVKLLGPGAVPIALTINGEKKSLQIEPRVTLLDALRNHLPLTGAKEVCDRGTCGACTVLYGEAPIYACMKIAIDAQDKPITTIEGLAQGGQLTPVQKAFVEADALMCGYCTSGFVMSVTALLQRQPKPTPDDVVLACSGNLCRCGTYPRVMIAAQRAAGLNVADPAQFIPISEIS
jgi:aerobic-type carbon monoxide dehydrogenase small subunit (CoxS/CutS family)